MRTRVNVGQLNSRPGVADHQLSGSCRDDCGEKGGAWYPPWELMMVLGLEFLAWLLPGSLSLLHS